MRAESSQGKTIAAIGYVDFARCAFKAGWHRAKIVNVIATCFPYEYRETADCVVEIAELDPEGLTDPE
jgi:hypothetical protein